uniref:Uncharacterized protein n=1 Tax=Bosea sp. NBC_00436 TaxID=2969620 RepID=A0A9E7ZMW3_9HYPH
MGTVHQIRPGVEVGMWCDAEDGRYITEATAELPSGTISVSLEVEAVSKNLWWWTIGEWDDLIDDDVIVRSGYAPSLAKARELAEAGAAAVLDDAVRYCATRAA